MLLLLHLFDLISGVLDSKPTEVRSARTNARHKGTFDTKVRSAQRYTLFSDRLLLIERLVGDCSSPMLSLGERTQTVRENLRGSQTE